MAKKTKPSAASHSANASRWILGGASLDFIGLVVTAFIVGFDIPVSSRAAILLLLTLLGSGIAVYGLVVRRKKRAHGADA
jgi:hypothetical protein